MERERRDVGRVLRLGLRAALLLGGRISSKVFSASLNFLAQPSSVFKNSPMFRPRRALRIKNTIRVPLLAHLQQPWVIRSPVRLLPVRLIDIGLLQKMRRQYRTSLLNQSSTDPCHNVA